MATVQEIASLRRFIDEPTEATYTDVQLGLRLDVAASPADLAREIWVEKAAAYTSLVDMQEGTSSRKLSQLRDNALAMAAAFGSGGTLVPSETSTVRRTTIRDIERV
jgi:hypothetical protein